jgi:hypothetical protein
MPKQNTTATEESERYRHQPPHLHSKIQKPSKQAKETKHFHPRLTPNQNQLEKQRKPKNFSSAYAETSQLGIG